MQFSVKIAIFAALLLTGQSLLTAKTVRRAAEAKAQAQLEVELEALRRITARHEAKRQEAAEKVEEEPMPIEEARHILTAQLYKTPEEQFAEATKGFPRDTTKQIITAEQYDDEYPNHEKRTLTYWVADETLSNEAEEIEDSYGEFEFLDHWGYGSEDPDCVFVRDLNEGSDYAIFRDERSYREVVDGFDAE